MIKIEINNVNEISKAAIEIIKILEQANVFLFEGSMGAGKTTLIKSVCENLGVLEIVNSPTFSIVNEYSTENRKTIFHFDCYRINNIEEAKEIGLEEYLYSNNYCFIEWAENIESLLPNKHIIVKIETVDDTKRIVTIKEHEIKE